jgi:hypothetical protein
LTVNVPGDAKSLNLIILIDQCAELIFLSKVSILKIRCVLNEQVDIGLAGKLEKCCGTGVVNAINKIR